MQWAFVRQTGTYANAVGGAPTYWIVGNSLDLGDLTATQTSYRRFAANGISMLNGNTLSLATSATRGNLTLGATYNDFRPITRKRCDLEPQRPDLAGPDLLAATAAS